MRILSEALLAAQKAAPIAYPKAKVEIKNKRGSVVHLVWERLYTGSEEDNRHCTTMPGDGSLLRWRIETGTPAVLYYQRVANPDEESNYSSWTNFAQYVTTVAACSYGANVIVFCYENFSPNFIYRESSDNGATWGDWATLFAPAHQPYHLTASMKPNGDVCLISFEWDTIYAIKRVSGSWSTSEVLYENYTTGDDGYQAIYGVQWMAQTFTPSTGHVIGKVRLKLYRVGSPGTTTVSIRETDANGHPIGVDLCSGTINGDTLTTDTAGAWYEITLSYGFYLSPNTKYALVIRATTGTSENYICWLLDTTTATYTGGNAETCGDSGVTWGALTTQDFMFEEYCHTQYVYSNPKNKPDICSSLAVVYQDDWNVLVTGRDASNNRCVWTCVFGDGNQAPLNNWTDLEPSIQMEDFTNYDYKAVYLDYLDTFRAFWVEWYSATEEVHRIYWTHSIPDKDFIDNLWREPIPFNLTSDYGIAICHSATHAWLTTPYGVWRATRAVTTWDITDDVEEVVQWWNPKLNTSHLKVVLNNTTGTYNDFDKLGYEIIVSLGYKTNGSYEYCDTPSFWVTGWKFRSPPWFPLRMIYRYGVIGTLEIEAEDCWDLLKGWKARRPFEWTADDKTVKQLLEFVLARAGFALGEFSSSTAVNNFKPAFEILEGRTGKWAVTKLLSWVEDVLVQRGSTLYLKHPQAADAVDYIYNSQYWTAHIVFRGNYGEHLWDPNRAQVWGTNLMLDRFEWDQVDQVNDRLALVETPTYPDTTRAAERATKELRKGEIWTGEGGWTQIPTNCGQELFDVIQITDYTAGVIAIKRRVIGIRTTFTKKYYHSMQVLKLGLP